MGSADASAVIDSLSAALARETDGSKVLSVEARAASIYWKLWRNVPVRFAPGAHSASGLTADGVLAGPISGLHLAREPRC
jgi:hypothetical protein